MKRQKDRTLKDELSRSLGARNAAGDQWRNNSRKNEVMEPKQKQHPVVDVTGNGSKVQCCKEQYCIGTWNVRSLNQGKLEVVKQEMARVNVNILGISELKYTETCIIYKNDVPVEVQCRIQDAWGWCTGMNQRDSTGREMGGGFRMGNTCTPVVDSC